MFERCVGVSTGDRKARKLDPTMIRPEKNIRIELWFSKLRVMGGRSTDIEG